VWCRRAGLNVVGGSLSNSLVSGRRYDSEIFNSGVLRGKTRASINMDVTYKQLDAPNGSGQKTKFMQPLPMSSHAHLTGVVRLEWACLPLESRGGKSFASPERRR